MTDYRNMSDGEFLHTLGDDAMKWARAFCQLCPNNPGVDVMLGWFANAIEHSHDIRTGRVHNGDHMEYLIQHGLKPDGTKSAIPEPPQVEDATT